MRSIGTRDWPRKLRPSALASGLATCALAVIVTVACSSLDGAADAPVGTNGTSGAGASGQQPPPSMMPPPSGTHALDVTKSGEGGGVVTSAPPGIDCGTSCTAAFAAGSSVVLTATPMPGSTFEGWAGACTGSGTCLVDMSADRTVTAAFSASTSTCASCKTYFVDNSGTPACSDAASSGSEAQPWCTISYALTQIAGGDTIYVKQGTYQEDVYIGGPNGSAGAPTTLRTYPGQTVVLQGSGVDSGRVKIVGASYVNIDGFTITNYNQGLFVESSDHVDVANCTIHDVGQEGLHVHYDASYVTIDHATIHDTRKWMYNGEGIYIGTGDSAPVDNTNHVVVRNSTIHDTTDEGIELKIGTHHCTLEGNTIFRVNLGSDWSQNGAGVGAIEVNAAVGSVQHYDGNPEHVVRNNTVHDVATAIRAGTGSTVYNNVVWGVSGYGILVDDDANDDFTRFVYHNTIDASASSALVNSGGAQDVKNNIGPAIAFNLARNAAWFVSTVTGAEDYHLVAGSAPIDAGTTTIVTVDKDGYPRDGSPDMGAYEYH